MSERRARTGFWLVVGYFVLATIANAYVRAKGFDARVLDHRAFDFGWELGLPWRASHGHWVGRDFAYPIGPLWQLLAWVGTLGARASPAASVGGLHVVFPIASLATAGALSTWWCPRWSRRTLVFAALALFALHDDVRSFRALVSVAIVMLYAPRRGSTRAPFLAGALVIGSTLLSFETALLGLLSLVFMFIAELVARRTAELAEPTPDTLTPLSRSRRAALGLVAASVALSLLWAAVGGSFWAALKGWGAITGGYVTVMIEGAHGLGFAPVWAFIGFSLVLLALSLTRRGNELTSAVLLAGALPLLARAIIRSDAEHVYAALLPLAVALSLSAVELYPRRPARSAASALLVTTFALAWFGSRQGVPNAWAPGGFSRAARLLADRSPDERGYDHDVPKIARFAQAHREACMVLPERAVVAHALANVRGPTETGLRWTPRMKEQLAADIERDRCPFAVRQLSSFDFPAPWQSFGFGADFLAQSLLYEPAERLGPATFVSHLRAQARRADGQPVAAEGLGDTRSLPVPGRLGFSLARPVAWENLLRLDYTLNVPMLRVLAGGSPWIKVAFYDGNERLGAVTALADTAVNERARAIIPVHAEVAEWRWAAGRSSRVQRHADRFEIIAEARPLSPASIDFELHGIEELTPPPIDGAKPPSCSPEVDLAASVTRGESFARGLLARLDGEGIVLDPNPETEPLAEVFLPVTPCKDSCLFAELGVEADAGPPRAARFEVHVVDDWEKPRLVNWQVTAGVSPKPAEISLSAWAGRDVLVRFGTWPVGSAGARARVYRPRIGPCRGKNLVHALHDGRYTLARGQAEPRGDSLRLSVAPLGRPPTELRIPIEIGASECLAYDLSVDAAAGAPPPSIELSLLHDKVSVRLSRDIINPGESRSHRDMSLAELRGQSAEVRIAAWGPDPSALALVSRLRVHRCGDGAPWGFGPERR